jgi:hypothetical protein
MRKRKEGTVGSKTGGGGCSYYARQSPNGTNAIMYMFHFFRNNQYLVQAHTRVSSNKIVQQTYLGIIKNAHVVLVASRLQGDFPKRSTFYPRQSKRGLLEHTRVRGVTFLTGLFKTLPLVATPFDLFAITLFTDLRSCLCLAT